eukprot:3850605-Rhodomonas_salina.1
MSATYIRSTSHQHLSATENTSTPLFHQRKWSETATAIIRRMPACVVFVKGTCVERMRDVQSEQKKSRRAYVVSNRHHTENVTHRSVRHGHHKVIC